MLASLLLLRRWDEEVPMLGIELEDGDLDVVWDVDSLLAQNLLRVLVKPSSKMVIARRFLL